MSVLSFLVELLRLDTRVSSENNLEISSIRILNPSNNSHLSAPDGRADKTSIVRV